MSAINTMYYVWLYLSHGTEVLAPLIHALSIPASNVVAGRDAQAVAANAEHLNESGLQYYDLKGDFLLSCDVRILGGTLAQVKQQLVMLSKNSFRIAMVDQSTDNPFECVLFDGGRSQRVMVLKNDDTDHVKLYPAG